MSLKLYVHIVAKKYTDDIIDNKISELQKEKPMVYLGKMEKKYKVLEEYINEVKEEKSMEQKKYKVEKSLPINIGLLVGHIYDESYFKYLDIARIIKEEYIKEVKEDTLESILENYRRPDTWNIENDILKTKLSKWHNKDVVEQKIELLKEVLEFIPISYSEYVNNKISELQKEIK